MTQLIFFVGHSGCGRDDEYQPTWQPRMERHVRTALTQSASPDFAGLIDDKHVVKVDGHHSPKHLMFTRHIDDGEERLILACTRPFLLRSDNQTSREILSMYFEHSVLTPLDSNRDATPRPSTLLSERLLQRLHHRMGSGSAKPGYYAELAEECYLPLKIFDCLHEYVYRQAEASSLRVGNENVPKLHVERYIDDHGLLVIEAVFKA